MAVEALLQTIWATIFGICGIGFIIAFHEFGHFIFGKLFGVTIPSFSIGFGPQLLKKKFGDTTFSLSLIPIGGYVEVESGSYDNPKPGTIAALAYWQKMLMIIGGIFCNILFSYAVFVGLYTIGTPTQPFFASDSQPMVIETFKDSAAQKAGILAYDSILSINGKDVSKDMFTLMDTLKKNPNKKVHFLIMRDGHAHEITALLGAKQEGDKKVGSLGVQFGARGMAPVPFLEAFSKSFSLTWSLFKAQAKGFLGIFKKNSTTRLSGPLAMMAICIKMAQKSTVLLLFLFAYISIALAVLNIIPLPILDGGQALTYTIEALIGKALPETTLEYIHMGSWIFMLGLFIVLTFKDVITLWFS